MGFLKGGELYDKGAVAHLCPPCSYAPGLQTKMRQRPAGCTRSLNIIWNSEYQPKSRFTDRKRSQLGCFSAQRNVRAVNTTSDRDCPGKPPVSTHNDDKHPRHVCDSSTVQIWTIEFTKTSKPSHPLCDELFQPDARLARTEQWERSARRPHTERPRTPLNRLHRHRRPPPVVFFTCTRGSKPAAGCGKRWHRV